MSVIPSIRLNSNVYFALQVTVKNAVNRVTGGVRVNGDFVQEADKVNHVEVLPRRGDPTETVGRIIRFKSLTKGFSKEVKLTRGNVQA